MEAAKPSERGVGGVRGGFGIASNRAGGSVAAMFSPMGWRLLVFGGTMMAMALASSAQEIWRLDNLKTTGGQSIRVVGAPRVGEVDGRSALIFDGAHDGIFVPAIPTAGSRAFTIEVLMAPASDGPEAQRFFHAEDEAGRRTLQEIRTDGTKWWLDGFLRTNPEPQDIGLTLIDPQKTHPVGRWYWVALRYDGKQLANFVDGVEQCRGAGDFVALGAGKVSIGVRQNLVYWFKGAIAEVQFHREAIPADRLQRIAR